MRATARKAIGADAIKVRNSSTATTYEAASTTRRTFGWTAPTLGPNDATLGNLSTLRDRARLACRNDGLAAAAVDRFVANLIGTGIPPMSLAADPAFREQVQALWERWTDYADADGVQEYYGQQSQIARCLAQAGEVFVRLRFRLPGDGLPVPLQLQVIEPEFCPHTYNAVSPITGYMIRAGIERDPIGRRVAYWFYSQRPDGWQDFDSADIRRVPAESVCHVYRAERPGQLRGVPPLTRALIRLREIDAIDDATRVRQQLSAMFVAFLKHPTSDTSSVVPLTGEESPATEGNRPVLGLQPGIFQELQPGEEVDFSDPPAPATGLDAYMRLQYRAAAVALGVPYEVLTGDLSGVNDRSVRVILHDWRRQLQADQHQLIGFQLCRPVWLAWLDQAMLAGALPIPAAAYARDPEPWARVRFSPPAWPYLHPVQDVEAQQAAIRAGLTSRSAVVSEQGEHAADIDRQQADDNARADELGLRYDSDARSAPAKTPQPGADGSFGESAAPAPAPGGKTA